jgi:hypothetical protein
MYFLAQTRKKISDFINKHINLIIWLFVSLIILLFAVIGALLRVCIYLKAAYFS